MLLISVLSFSASGDRDFVAIPDLTVVTFAPSETVQGVNVVIIDDQIFEDDEQFRGVLSLDPSSVRVGLGANDVASATIADDDGGFDRIKSNI